MRGSAVEHTVRALQRRIDRPPVGAVLVPSFDRLTVKGFGVAVYFLLASGLLMTKPPQGKVIYFYAIAAFLAGFSERFTGVMFGGAERLLSGDQQEDEPHVTTAQPRPATP